MRVGLSLPCYVDALHPEVGVASLELLERVGCYMGHLRADIVPNIHHAYRRPEWRSANTAVFQVRPSATADIEGVLHGGHGVRPPSALPLTRGERVLCRLRA